MRFSHIFSFTIFMLVVIYAHLLLSWAIPSEGDNLIFTCLTILLSPVIALLLRKQEDLIGKWIRNMVIALLLICLFHVFQGKTARSIYPWTELNSQITQLKSLPQPKDPYQFVKGIYTFPIINKQVEIRIYDEAHFGIDYGNGRHASFDYELNERSVD